jgi:hypothetical protein
VTWLEKYLEDPVQLTRLKHGFYAILAAILVSEAVAAVPELLYKDEPHFTFENWPAWGSLYGLVSCALIIVVSKLLGKACLMRRENYYDR